MRTSVKLVILIIISFVVFVLVKDMENKAPERVRDNVEGFRNAH